MSTPMQGVAGTEVPLAPRYGWFSALGALIGGSIVASLGLLVLALALSVAGVHVLPGNTPGNPGPGWPWPIDGVWAAFADLGPLLLAGVSVAAGIAFYVGPRAGHPTARWPLVLCATLVGWVPIVQTSRSGLLGVSGGFAFVAMWWTTRKTSEMRRPRLPRSRHPRIEAGVAAGAIIALALVSLTYGALHPVAVGIFTSPASATLHDGRTDRFPISLYNQGPLPVRILTVSLARGSDLRIARVERPSGLTEGPTIDSLYAPAGTPDIAAGGELDLWLTLSGPSGCLSMAQTVDALELRVVVAGLDRTQRAPVGPGALHVNCRPSHRP